VLAALEGSRFPSHGHVNRTVPRRTANTRGAGSTAASTKVWPRSSPPKRHGTVTDPDEARISAQIARDEAEHAALAFDVLRWVVNQDRTLAPNRAEQAEAAPFASSPLGPRRVRELANHHSQSARSRFG